MAWNGEHRGWPMNEPIGWVVIRRRGGWNAEPEVVRFYERETPAMLDSMLAHMCTFDPPADRTDLFTYHAVLPPKWPVSLPAEVKTVDRHPTGKDVSDMALFKGVRLARLSLVEDDDTPDDGDPTRPRLVLQRWSDDVGVFYLESDWKRLHRIEDAIRDATTWGEFEDGLPPGEFDSLGKWQSNDGEYLYRRSGRIRFVVPGSPESANEDEWIIGASDPFDPRYLPGYEDGDYPRWLGKMVKHLPPEFLAEFGEHVGSMVSGRWVEFPLARADEMAEALGEAGYEVVLVNVDYPWGGPDSG